MTIEYATQLIEAPICQPHTAVFQSSYQAIDKIARIALTLATLVPVVRFDQVEWIDPARHPAKLSNKLWRISIEDIQSFRSDCNSFSNALPSTTSDENIELDDSGHDGISVVFSL